jgi:hypothetical protein
MSTPTNHSFFRAAGEPAPVPDKVWNEIRDTVRESRRKTPIVTDTATAPVMRDSYLADWLEG